MVNTFRPIIELDARLSDQMRLQPGSRFWLRVAAFLAHSGDSWFWLAGRGLVWLFSKGDWHSRAAILAIAVVMQALLVFAVKFSIRRQRPEGDWGAIYRNTDPHSFPSGHATRSGLLLMLALGLGPAWFALAIALWAPLMSLARVAMGVHYISDIVAGFLFGLGCGWIFLQIYPWITTLAPFLFH
jgi:membrane-associated phospholipid phosphatase